MRVQNVINNRGNSVANQFIIEGAEHNGKRGTFFQSYQTMVAFVPNDGSRTMIDPAHDCSRTTSKHCTQFLGMNTADRRKAVKAGDLILEDLN